MAREFFEKYKPNPEMKPPFIYRECEACHGVNCHLTFCIHYKPSPSMNITIKLTDVTVVRDKHISEEAVEKAIRDRVSDALISHDPLIKDDGAAWIQRFNLQVDVTLDPELEFLEGAIDRLKKLDAPTRARALHYLTTRFGGK